MNLAIDFGNTLTKVGIFNHHSLMKVQSQVEFSESEILKLLSEFNVKDAILSASGPINNATRGALKKRTALTEFDEHTAMPIKNLYKTTETLGKDRLAAVVGAHSLFPKTNNLVVDAGTCITFDFINEEREYIGGSISPGIDMRFKALNTFTQNLPLVSRSEKFSLAGSSTEESLLSGVLIGVLSEIENRIGQWRKAHQNLKVILTGGDASFFETHLKSEIFAVPNLVIKGLNEILEYNIGGCTMIQVKTCTNDCFLSAIFPVADAALND